MKKRSFLIVFLVIVLFISSFCVFTYAVNAMEEIEGRNQRVLGDWNGSPFSLSVSERGLILSHWGKAVLETTYHVLLTDKGTVIHPDKNWIILDGMSEITLIAVNENIMVLRTEGDYGTRLYPLKTERR